MELGKAEGAPERGRVPPLEMPDGLLELEILDLDHEEAGVKDDQCSPDVSPSRPPQRPITPCP